MYQRDYRDLHALEPDPAYVRRVRNAIIIRALSLALYSVTLSSAHVTAHLSLLLRAVLYCVPALRVCVCVDD
jgi:hypothetical protein